MRPASSATRTWTSLDPDSWVRLQRSSEVGFEFRKSRHLKLQRFGFDEALLRAERAACQSGGKINGRDLPKLLRA
jgi:hypothetical protein